MFDRVDEPLIGKALPMVTITSTTYMDFLLKTGLGRLRVVKQARRQYLNGYVQGGDYYKRLRDGIVTMHRENGNLDDLRHIVDSAPTKGAKRDNYTSCLGGYEQWIAGKGIVWASRPKPHFWRHSELEVRATPELRITIEGVPHRVKLYFKEPKITQAGANLVIHLHEAAGWADDRIAVLDVRRAKLFTKTRVDADYETVLRSEAESFLAMWQSLRAAEGETGTG
jgi:hypothetical protein